MSDATTITITRETGYRFVVDFGDALPQWLADEPPPLGSGAGPAPTQLLLASVANCLAASLLFALRKFGQDPGRVSATATASVERNDAKRLRVPRIRVDLRLQRAAAELAHVERALAQFEDFCTVSMSVRQGIAIDVGVVDGTGERLAGRPG